MAGFSLGAFAELKENPYQVIIDRNPFGLRPIPPPPEVKPPDPITPPPLDIKLTGITTLLGPPRALLEITDPQTKKVDRPSPFVEGDVYKDTITIVSIDAENNRVKIRNGAAETTLDFEKNGIKPTGGTASAAPAHPGAPPNMGLPVPAPTAAAGGVSALGQPGHTGKSILGGGVSPISAAPNAAANVYGNNLGGIANTAGGSLVRPIRTADPGNSVSVVGGGPGYPQPTAAGSSTPQQPSMSREELIARLQAQRDAYLKQGNSAALIVPPPPGGAPAPVPGH